MAKRDYYEVLGIKRETDKAGIKKAYRKLARRFHPDVNRDDPDAAAEKFKEVSEAYEVLIDPEKRQRYDRFGHEGVDFGGGGFSWDNFTHAGDVSDIFGQMFSSRGGSGGGGGGGGLGDIFAQFFGGGNVQRRATNRGEDLRYDLELSLEEAFEGLTREVSVPRNEPCETCSGSGAAKGGQPHTCGQCGGQGMVQSVQRRGFMQQVTTHPCPACKGQGQTIDKPCKACHGRGLQEKSRKLKLTIPAGVDDGHRLRLRREGNAGPQKGARGDLYVMIHLHRHKYFQRHDTELLYELEITPAQAVLGEKVEVPTIDGKVKLDIPAGTQSDRVLRLRGKGMSDLNRPGRRGDQHVHITVRMPKAGGKARKLWEQLREIERSDEESLLGRAKRKLRGK